MPYTLPLTDLNRHHLPRAGGKGANLGELLAAGLPVPPGFCVLTEAYRAFVDANSLRDELLRDCAAVDATDPAALERLSGGIRARFAAGRLPPDLAAEIGAAYRGFDSVAVRSSATAEDLPDFSFAGQQDTYLNVQGAEALLAAVVRCWASLWTARAIAYRARNHIDHGDVALAVVVQAMIPSEAAGVLFTANPLSGRRDQTVIDATFGLGEALVSGLVEPDHYVVVGERICAKTLGAKALSIRAQAGGGTQTLPEDAAARQALTDEDILALARLGQRAAEHFGAPQDVEWSLAAGQRWLLQSRPVTSLYPLPEHHRGPDHLMALVSFGAVQGMMDPVTPLGRDAFLRLALSMAGVFGSTWNARTQTLVYEAGERLFLDINGALRHPLGRKVVLAFLPAVEPGAAEALAAYLDDPRLAVRAQRWGWAARLHLLRVFGTMALRVALNLLLPRRRRQRIQNKIEAAVRGFAQARACRVTAPAQAVEFAEFALWEMPQRLFLWLVAAVVAGQAGFQGLRRLASRVPDGDRLALETMRGLAHNVTTEMDLALWHTAQAIRQDAAARAFFETTPAAALAQAFQAGCLPPAAQAALEAFLRRYGMRGVAEVDLGRIRWREDATPVMQSLAAYLKIERPEAAPDVVFAQGAVAAAAAIEELKSRLRAQPGGWWRAPLAGLLARRVRELAGLRETPKFTIIRIFGMLREALLEAGRAWAAAGWLECAEDVAFLRLAELDELGRLAAAAERPAGSEWRERVAQRQALVAREKQRRQAPRLLMGDGTAVYEGVGGAVKAGETLLRGSPVSSGQAEGVVQVVFDPFTARLAPGEILVCPGTDPAWTPLFLTAGGLVMEVGGLMTHGSVVAREYGIPAVVGVGRATQRLHSGMRVRVDGSAGTVTILDGG